MTAWSDRLSAAGVLVGIAPKENVQSADEALSERLLDARAGYNEAASIYDDWDWQRLWHESNEWPLIAGTLKRWYKHSSENNPCPRILDVGAGTGRSLENLERLFPSSERFGLDVSEGMLEEAKKRLRSNATLIQGDILDFQAQNLKFDIILMQRTSSHVGDLDKLVVRLEENLAERGIIIISDIVTTHDYKYTKIRRMDGDIRIQTYKHPLKKWKKSFVSVGLKLKSLDFVRVDDINRDFLNSCERLRKRLERRYFDLVDFSDGRVFDFKRYLAKRSSSNRRKIGYIISLERH